MCRSVYVTLCIYTRNSLAHSSIEEMIGLEPTRTSKKNDLYGWFISTQCSTNSKDINDHLKLLISIIDRGGRFFEIQRKKEYQCRIMAFWESESGNGGPVLHPETMRTIADLNLELHFDIWLDLPDQH
ncbi:DUF4279 domain-containing protein [Chitiniphilus shinanonensis]|uniref:DUF4279 domain-containing protein n=1 Tax=Chitiniphilus shinanonensis TaxID=553088 RepID=UPI00333EC926